MRRFATISCAAAGVPRGDWVAEPLGALGAAPGAPAGNHSPAADASRASRPVPEPPFRAAVACGSRAHAPSLGHPADDAPRRGRRARGGGDRRTHPPDVVTPVGVERAYRTRSRRRHQREHASVRGWRGRKNGCGRGRCGAPECGIRPADRRGGSWRGNRAGVEVARVESAGAPRDCDRLRHAAWSAPNHGFRARSGGHRHTAGDGRAASRRRRGSTASRSSAPMASRPAACASLPVRSATSVEMEGRAADSTAGLRLVASDKDQPALAHLLRPWRLQAHRPDPQSSLLRCNSPAPSRARLNRRASSPGGCCARSCGCGRISRIPRRTRERRRRRRMDDHFSGW